MLWQVKTSAEEMPLAIQPLVHIVLRIADTILTIVFQ